MSNKTFTLSKSLVESYKIRGETSSLWADITIDAKENTGRIQIASDFGDWQYYWGACGSSFKKFLIGLDINYAAGKFGASNWFNLEATISGIRNRFEEFLSENENYDVVSKELISSEISDLENSYNREEFAAKFWSSEELNKVLFDGDYPELQTSIQPMFKRFWNEIWPIFINELKKEIE